MKRLCRSAVVHEVTECMNASWDWSTVEGNWEIFKCFGWAFDLTDQVWISKLFILVNELLQSSKLPSEPE